MTAASGQIVSLMTQKLLSSKEQGDKSETIIWTRYEWPTRQQVKIQVFTKHPAIRLSMESQLFRGLLLQ